MRTVKRRKWNSYERAVARERSERESDEQIKIDLLMILVKLNERNQQADKTNQKSLQVRRDPVDLRQAPGR